MPASAGGNQVGNRSCFSIRFRGTCDLVLSRIDAGAIQGN